VRENPTLEACRGQLGETEASASMKVLMEKRFVRGKKARYARGGLPPPEGPPPYTVFSFSAATVYRFSPSGADAASSRTTTPLSLRKNLIKITELQRGGTECAHGATDSKDSQTGVLAVVVLRRDVERYIKQDIARNLRRPGSSRTLSPMFARAWRRCAAFLATILLGGTKRGCLF
jgi:hypothetical protein